MASDGFTGGGAFCLWLNWKLPLANGLFEYGIEVELLRKGEVGCVGGSIDDGSTVDEFGGTSCAAVGASGSVPSNQWVKTRPPTRARASRTMTSRLRGEDMRC